MFNTVNGQITNRSTSGFSGTNVDGLGYGGDSEGTVTEAGSRGGLWDEE